MRFIIILLMGIMLGLASGCKKEWNYRTYGELGFSADTVKIDTIFTTFPSPTYRLFVYNQTNKGLSIKRIRLAGGQQSEFKVIVDGVAGASFENVLLEPNDSIYIFVSLLSNEKEKTVLDSLIFELENRTDKVVLYAHVLDAYFFRSTLDTAYVFDCNYVLPTDKPCIMDGYMYVPENCTLTIPAGAEVRFSSKKNEYAIPISQILVDGTLLIQGTANQKVLLDTWRLDESVKEDPSQWMGLHFLKKSKSSVIQHAIIKNGHIGVQVDSLSLNNEPKVRIEQTEIRNFANFGILGLGAHPSIPAAPNILATNTLIHNCGQSNVGLYFGGKYEFYHCTFANYSRDVRRSEPVLAISDYLDYEENGQPMRLTYPLQAYFANTIIWGSEEQEWKTDFKGGNATVLFENCLIKTKTDNPPSGSNNIYNQDPRFQKVEEQNFSLQAGSPCINNGKEGLGIVLDIQGNTRQDVPDIGAFEFFP